MKKVLGIVAGLVFFLAPLYAWIVNFKGFGDAAFNFLKGGAVWALLLIGLGLLAVGFTNLKE